MSFEAAVYRSRLLQHVDQNRNENEDGRNEGGRGLTRAGMGWSGARLAMGGSSAGEMTGLAQSTSIERDASPFDLVRLTSAHGESPSPRIPPTPRGE
jgi:hypothetical protein